MQGDKGLVMEHCIATMGGISICYDAGFCPNPEDLRQVGVCVNRGAWIKSWGRRYSGELSWGYASELHADQGLF